jgi:hypothetical protein
MIETAAGVLGKTIRLDHKGEKVSEPGGRMIEGECWAGDATGMQGVASRFGRCSSKQAITLGVPRGGFDGTRRKRITTKKRRRELPPGQQAQFITRSLEFFAWPAGPGIILLDHDRGGMPPEVARKIGEHGGLWGVLTHYWSALKDCGRIVRVSASAGIRNAKTGEKYDDSGGQHIYLAVKDPHDAKRVLKAIFDKLWAEGFGWINISKAGSFLVRGPIDLFVASPERLSFEGQTVVEPPLVQVRPEPRAEEGEFIDTGLVFLGLTPAEKAEADRRIREERERQKPKAQSIRTAWLEARIDKAIAEAAAKGEQLSRADVEAELMAAFAEDDARLTPDHRLAFDDPEIGTVTVAGVLAAPEGYVDETLADPLDDDRPGKAKLMRDTRTGALFIHSFAHGGGRYRLVHNARTIRDLVDRTSPAELLRAFATAMSMAELHPGDEPLLVQLCVTKGGGPKSGFGSQAVRRAIREAQARLDQARQDAAEEAAGEDADRRVTIKAPARDGEVMEAARRIDEVLAEVKGPHAPVRNAHGLLAELAPVRLPGMHLLQGAGENPIDEDIPPPPEYILRQMSLSRVRAIVEKHVRLVTKGKSGKRAVTPSDALLKALNALYGESRLPAVHGVQTIPFVRRKPNGSCEILKLDGFDQASGVMFQIEPAVAAAMPEPSAVTLEKAKAAYKWLADEFLVDVSATRADKAVAVALALTIIQRHYFLNERPGFLVTAGAAGTGKTTVINMISEALFGRSAAAARWGDTPKDRGTALFSYCRESLPLIVWDNIKRGTGVDDDHIAAALTSRAIRDRLFHTQETQEAPATTIQIFTGNSIAAVGDLRTRVLPVSLTADREDPENRDFKHPNPLEWVRAKRNEILNKLYTILALPLPVPNYAPTRMKVWWTEVGRRIELLSDVRFTDMITAAVDDDPVREGLAIVVGMLHGQFGLSQFRTRQVMDSMYGSVPSDDEGDLLGERPRWTSGEVEDFSAALRAAYGEREDALQRMAALRVIRWDSQRLGARLRALTGRPIEIDGATLLLEMVKSKSKEGATFSVAVVGL